MRAFVRILADLTEAGKQLVCKLLGVGDITLARRWGNGSEERAGSILLCHDFRTPLSIFALLENGCREVYRLQDRIAGFEPPDIPERRDRFVQHYGNEIIRRYAYEGTAGDRNRHVFTGRVE
ncbi:MAG TPA: hypothetical protein VEL76_32570 [Gemmataceae bacterium]|nr:hypothetical protein [Gemmataceae bacterium]